MEVSVCADTLFCLMDFTIYCFKSKEATGKKAQKQPAEWDNKLAQLNISDAYVYTALELP